MDRRGEQRSRAEEHLLEILAQMQAGRNRFLPEEKLAKELNVSRATLREALQVLGKEGFVTSLQGSGNYGHPSAMSLKHRIDLCGDFLLLSASGNQKVTCECKKAGFTKATEIMKRYYPAPCDDVYELQWVYSAGGKPTILSRIYIPASLIVGEPAPSQEDGKEKLADWIHRCCARDYAYYSTYLSCCVDPQANEMLELTPDTPLQNWRQVTYDLYDEPVAFCDNFFHSENIELTMVMRP